MNIPEQTLARSPPWLDMVVQKLHMGYRHTWGGQYNALPKGNRKTGSQSETFVLFAWARRGKHSARPKQRALPRDGWMDKRENFVIEAYRVPYWGCQGGDEIGRQKGLESGG
jgi:hypothetical protein